MENNRTDNQEQQLWAKEGKISVAYTLILKVNGKAL